MEGAARKTSRGEHVGLIYPIALEAVRGLDALFDIERGINRKRAADRLAMREELSAPQVPVALVVSLSERVNEGEAELAAAMGRGSCTEPLTAHLKLQIAKLKREQYGPSAERNRRLLDPLELQLEELEVTGREDELSAESMVAAKTTNVAAFSRKRPARKPARARDHPGPCARGSPVATAR